MAVGSEKVERSRDQGAIPTCSEDEFPIGFLEIQRSTRLVLVGSSEGLSETQSSIVVFQNLKLMN